MKVYITTAEITKVLGTVTDVVSVSTETRTFSNLKKAYTYALAEVGVASGITPAYSSLARILKKQGYLPISGRRYDPNGDIENYFLTHICRVGIEVKEVE